MKAICKIITGFFKLTVLIMIVVPVSAGNAQNVVWLRSEHDRLERKLEISEQKLDSLYTLIQERAAQIEKIETGPDGEKKDSDKLRASSVLLTKQYGDLLKKTESDREKLHRQKKILFRRYGEMIDSLEKAGGDLNDKILFLSEQRIIVSPVIQELKINPVKILDAKVENMSDPLRKKILAEYINSALAEVDSLLLLTGEQRGELDGIFKLQKKSERFLKETEFDRNTRSLSILSSRQNEEAVQTNSDFFGEGRNLTDKSISSFVLVQFDSYSKILNQLPSADLSYGAKKSVSLIDLRNIMLETENELKEYRELLVTKLQSLNEKDR